MKTYYYDLDNARFVDSAGEPIPRCVPELFYQERAEWQIALRDGGNVPADLSRIAVWGAAVDCDFSTSSVPMCRTLSDGITADTTTGAVTVALDCSTAEFLAAVDGNPSRQAWFGLYGLDAEGERILYLCIEIRARMTLDPDPEVSPETPDTVATKAYVSAVMSSGAAAAGAIMSGAAFTTTVGGYTVALTSGGGLAVSGSGASVVLSGGEIVGAVKDGNDNGAEIGISSGNAHIKVINDAHTRELALTGETVKICGEDYGSQWESPVATQLVTSTDQYSTNAYIEVLSGGTSYVCTQPQEQIIVVSVAKSTEASYLHFTLGSVTAPTPVVISGVSYLNSATFEGGKEYLVGFFDGMAVVNEVTQ